MEKSANNKLWSRYIRFLGYKHSKNLISIECWGGCWQLPREDRLYHLILVDGIKTPLKDEIQGLLPLTPDINIEEVEEYFADLIIYDSEVIRVEIEIEFHLN